MINVAEIEARMQRAKLLPGEIALELSASGIRITEREVRDIIKGVVIPSWDHLVKIAILLGCTPQELII